MAINPLDDILTESKSTASHRERSVARTVPLSERILLFSMPEPNSGCWLWLRSITQKGYPQLCFEKRRWEGHRAAWHAFNGAIPAGAHVLHRCNNAACVNPDHLYLGTDLENCHDRMRAGTQAKPPASRGDSHAMAKLSPKQAMHIRKSKARGVDLACKYGVSPATISAIRTGRLWAHLRDEDT